MTIVSGIQPSGRLHVGNYLGAVRNWQALQDDAEHRCFFFIADWHSLTEEYDPQGKAAQVRELAAELLALDIGVNRPHVALFRQSDLPEHLELAWYFACATPVGAMERMTQYKEKVARGESPNVGLFTYPILMAADILMYGNQKVGIKHRSIGVPVGHDQTQHLELVNDIARRVNRRYGTEFPEVQSRLTQEARIMSLKDPTHKMSKSLGGDHCLFLDDPPEEITRKVKASVTDVGSGKQEILRMSPGVRTLFELLAAFGSTVTIAQFKKAHDAGAIKYSELKPAVAAAVSSTFEEFRAKKAEFLADPSRIDAVLAAGADAARVVARETLAAVRRRVGVR